MAGSRNEEAIADSDRVEKLRRTVLTEAVNVVAAVGPEALKLGSLCHRLRLDRDDVEALYPNRDSLVSAVAAHTSQELVGILTVEGDFFALVDYLVDYVVEHPEISRLWMYGLLSENRAPVAATMGVYYEYVNSLAQDERVVAGVDAEALIQMALGGLCGWALYARETYGDDEVALQEAAHRYAKEFKRLLLHGLLPAEHWPEAAASLDRPSAADK